MKRLAPLYIANKVFRVLFLFTFVVFYYASVQIEAMPAPEEINSLLDNEPRQEIINKESFDFSYRGRDYLIEPIAEYEIWGLVVTHNDITDFIDIYHDVDSVDIRDICVLWGDNVKHGVYNNFNFWSEPWTCFFQAEDWAYMKLFNQAQISNSHLLSANPKVREAILNTRVGDQIHLSGKLINYAPKDKPMWFRKSSTEREDTGNGACEVIMVEKFSILKRANTFWHGIYTGSLNTLIMLAVVIPGLFLYTGYKETQL